MMLFFLFFLLADNTRSFHILEFFSFFFICIQFISEAFYLFSLLCELLISFLNILISLFYFLLNTQ